MKECTEEKNEGRWAEKSNERVEGAAEGEIRGRVGREGIRVGVKKKRWGKGEEKNRSIVNKSSADA